jgi:hypothetical protein
MTEEELLPKCEEYFNIIKKNLPYNSRFKRIYIMYLNIDISDSRNKITIMYEWGSEDPKDSKRGNYNINYSDIVQFIRTKKLNDLGI